MTTEGGSAQIVAAATVDPNSLEYRAEGNQGHTYQYYSSTPGSVPTTWPVHGGEHSNTGNQTAQNVTYQYNPQHPSTVQEGTNPSTISSTPAPPGTDNTSHTYNYATYPTSTNPYGYASSEYSSYYSNYQPQPNQTYNQAQGTYQNSGSTYQPISSFPNTGSYAGSTTYPSTYYNPGDYQTTTGAYTGSGYSGQPNLWNQGNYANYPQQYGNYSHDSSGAYGSSNAAPTTNYQQHYQQWADYYNSQTEVTCAPGTENTSVATTSALSCPIPGVSSGYGDPVSQPQMSYIPAQPQTTTYTPAWKPEDSSASLHSQQTSSTVGAYGDYWKQAYQQPQTIFPNPLDVNSSQPSVQTQPQPQTLVSQIPYSHYTEVQQSHPQPQPVQPVSSSDTLRVNNFQIPTNPRIASNVGVGGPKPIKDVAPPSLPAKPAYVSVSLTKPKNEALSNSASDSNLKPGVFPASLKGYVERALARCKDEKQRTACQEVMKEIITKATIDGTLYSRDWDIEPLFPLPDTSAVINEENAVPAVSLSTFKRSPSRRTKSRWEPLPEDKPIEKPISTFQDSSKSTSTNQDSSRHGMWVRSTSTYQDSSGHGMWAQVNGRDQKSQSAPGKSERKDTTFNRLSSLEQNSAGRNSYRPSKRQRFGNGSSVTENGDASSDSDKEQSLTAYYSGAVTLANSPEERKRRENRSKRFEKGNGQKMENHFRPKSVGSGNLYARRASALVLRKNVEDGGSRAVEDIDWDALTVKGTCQEIEKRYLRLTSAPDPSTVRPEEILEKALSMVQNSPKNYYYKCDQLKSIRQDLTVQRIRNELTVKVYETHARLALEFGDLPEFNQCQSQLKILYGEGIAGCHMEFSAYNLLSVSLHSNNRRDLLSLMSRLSKEAKKHEAVRHALSVRSAVASGNYVLFFRLYKSAPNLNTCLMDTCVEKVRFEAVKCMSRTYRPTIPIVYVAQVLGFNSTPESDERDLEGLEECMEWLKAHGACLIPDSNGEMVVDAKVSASSLYMPDPEDAVAHGDANLAVNDFLTRALT